jgi:asparagine synthase (glutamine-hydrolysing)
LAFTRLSIVDLSDAGLQPMANEDGSLVMVFNGEIYNSPELRRYCQAKGHTFSSSMDGEVILHLWEMEGYRALQKLNGIFALAIASTRTGDVILARDPVGVKPLFYCADEGEGLWFASELAALRVAGAPIGGLDVTAMAQFLSFLWIPDPRTPFIGAKSLEPGQALQWTPAGVRLFKYGAALTPDTDPAPLRPEAALEECDRRFNEAAHRQLLADVPIGLMASGGVDSGLIWAVTHDQIGEAFTIGWQDHSDGERLDEDTAAVAKLERRFGTLTSYLEGERAPEAATAGGDLFADPAHNLTRLIASQARPRGYKVLLSGQGGDELFAGYRRHQMAFLLQRLRIGGAVRPLEGLLGHLKWPGLGIEYLLRLTAALAEPDEFSAYMRLCTYSSAPERARVLGCTQAEVEDQVVWGRHRQIYESLPSKLSLLRKVMTIDLSVYLPGLGLAYVDRAGMEFGVEIRVPWLDLDFLRWTLGLPDDLLLRRGRGKWLTRRLAARYLPSEIAHRPKRSFAAPIGRVNGAHPRVRGQIRQQTYLQRAERILEAFRDTSLVEAGPAQTARLTG